MDSIPARKPSKGVGVEGSWVTTHGERATKMIALARMAQLGEAGDGRHAERSRRRQELMFYSPTLSVPTAPLRSPMSRTRRLSVVRVSAGESSECRYPWITIRRPSSGRNARSNRSNLLANALSAPTT